MANSAGSLIRLVDGPRVGSRIGQREVVVVDDVVMVEGIAQARRRAAQPAARA